MTTSHTAACLGESVLALQAALKEFDRRGGMTIGKLKKIENIEVWVEVRLAEPLGPQKMLEGPQRESVT